ncbi:nucleotidyltransferase family protein [Oryzifoliimicrobium ureilyticus]|uniref:nucleotidyltransferase family protein n=1 Tax=Oryzifoliimicrobium ureilyticus TaxID=3113724 RepID=UPI00307681E7
MVSERKKEASELQVATLLLAAGVSSRMGAGGSHKLLAEFNGVPLVRHMAINALESRSLPVTVVTGHRRAEIEAVLTDLPINLVHNPDYRSGMASSLVTGFAEPRTTMASGILVLLADMPRVNAAHLDLLIDDFRQSGGMAVTRAAHGDHPGNPVIIPRGLYCEMASLRGDQGAKSILQGKGIDIRFVDIGEAAVVDVDTPAAVLAEGGLLRN